MDSLEDLEGEEREREGMVRRIKRREKEERNKIELNHRRMLLKIHKKL